MLIDGYSNLFSMRVRRFKEPGSLNLFQTKETLTM